MTNIAKDKKGEGGMGEDEDWSTEEEIEVDSDEERMDEVTEQNQMEMDEPGETSESAADKPVKRQVYLPGKKLKKYEELVHDPSAYVMYHAAETVYSCLSFDVIPNGYGTNREAFPLTAYFVAGTQADKPNSNKIIVMKVSNLKRSQEDDDESSSSDSDDDDDSDADSDKLAKSGAKMSSILLRHHGTVNRIRCKEVGDKLLCAAWSDMGKVTLLDLKPYVSQVNTAGAVNSEGTTQQCKPLHVFSGHLTEGYAIDFSPTMPGVLATGDSRKNIHLWKPVESGWHVDQKPLIGHSQAVEDIQWSPNEPNVMASCSVDKTIRIWDTREKGAKACKLTVESAHESDVNVISWNRSEPLIVSGGDDGMVRIWDLRQFTSGNSVASLKHHFKAVTTVEWSPADSSVFASGGEDDQIAIWDLAAERDTDNDMEEEIQDLPQQLLFLHLGQEEVKELHWHPQITGMITSTAKSGFNFFRTISV